MPDPTPDLATDPAALRAENARLWAELHERKATEREVEYLKKLVAGMEASVSWRATRPLRIGKELAGKVRRRLAARQ